MCEGLSWAELLNSSLLKCTTIRTLLHHVLRQFDKTYQLESKSNISCRRSRNLDSILLHIAPRDCKDATTILPTQNEDQLVFSAWLGWAEIFGRDVVMLNGGACIAGCAEYSNTVVRCRSIRTAERVRACC